MVIRLQSFACVAVVVLTASALHAGPLAPIHARCSIAPSDRDGQFSLREWQGDDSKLSQDHVSRLTGITPVDLSREGQSFTAAMAAEAGTFTCSGTVRDGVLNGNSTFTPDQAFVNRMESMSFTGYTSEKLEAYAFFGVESAWVKSLEQTGVKGLTTNNLIALRMFNIDANFIESAKKLGFKDLDLNKLIQIRISGLLDDGRPRKRKANKHAL
jgi:hypothetical protein